MQESYDINGDRPKLGAWLAEQLGWNQWQGDSPHLCILTPYDIAETFAHEPWHGVGARLIDESGRPFIVWSIWLDYRAYITYELRDESGHVGCGCDRVGVGRVKIAFRKRLGSSPGSRHSVSWRARSPCSWAATGTRPRISTGRSIRRGSTSGGEICRFR